MAPKKDRVGSPSLEGDMTVGYNGELQPFAQENNIMKMFSKRDDSNITKYKDVKIQSFTRDNVTYDLYVQGANPSSHDIDFKLVQTISGKSKVSYKSSVTDADLKYGKF